MARDLVFGIKLRADGSGFVGEVRTSGEALKALARDARTAAQEVDRAGQDIGQTLTRATAIGATIGTVLGQAIFGIGRRIVDMTLESIDALDAYGWRDSGMQTSMMFKKKKDSFAVVD